MCLGQKCNFSTFSGNYSIRVVYLTSTPISSIKKGCVKGDIWESYDFLLIGVVFFIISGDSYHPQTFGGNKCLCSRHFFQ